MADSQTDMVQRCLEGEESAQVEFVNLFQHRVFALCLRMLGHRQDAEDVTQDVLVRALRYLKSWDSSRELAPWVLKIAANRCRTALSQRSTRPLPVELSVEPETPISEVEGVAEEVNRGLSGLREDHRACFVLFYQQELSVAEVAEVMDVPAGTVKTWLFRARKELADYLRKRGLGPENEQ